MTRAERAVEALALRAEGLGYREIGERMGISRSYASSLVTDPDGTKEAIRRERYRRPCPDCGTLMTGGDGNGPNAPRHCIACAPRAAQKWPRETIIAAIHDFHDLMGRPPHATDWNPAAARSKGTLEQADLFDANPQWPHAGTVQERFGSWNAGIREAGYEPTLRGYYEADEPTWTREDIILAIDRWVMEHEDAPTSIDWKYSGGETHPCAKTVALAFGSWNAAMEAAGYTPRRSGWQHVAVAA